MTFFAEIEVILKFMWNLTGPQIAKTILGKKQKQNQKHTHTGRLILPDFKTDNKVIKTLWYGIKIDT